MRFLVPFNGEYVEANWVVWLRFQYCTNPNPHNLTLLAFGAELPNSPALFMRPLPNYCIQHLDIPRPTPLDNLDFTHNYRDGLPPHLHNPQGERHGYVRTAAPRRT